MAALRILARNVLYTCNRSVKLTNYEVITTNKRWASFKTSPVYDETKKYTDFEVSTDPKEWSYVERCLKYKFIPLPKNEADLPSGWKPQKKEAKSYPYFIERSKNHMQPVYLHIDQRGLKRRTIVKKIEGDIVALEAELKKYLEEKQQKQIASQIFEPGGKITFRGDHVTLIKAWLDERGF